VEAIFRALGDENRRKLLDRLYQRDGQTLGELVEGMEMTRFGVMKHLRVLEDAGLVTTRKVGREKLHYLNPVPIQLIADRWISKFAAPWARAMTGLKHHLEEESMSRPMHQYEVYIQATAEAVWDALTNPEKTRLYIHSTMVESDWQPGSPIRYRYGQDGAVAVEGVVLEADRPRRLVHTWRAIYSPETAADAPSRVTWEIVPLGGACKVAVIHDEFEGETATYRSISRGWAPILNHLKSVLETGRPMELDEAALEAYQNSRETEAVG
jgi:uncharacterized protein YndB with AHSA1/START domain/DNA-binding transcriptional ArsR family regulator